MNTDTRPGDHPIDDDADESAGHQALERNVKSKATWLRLVYMLVFYVLASVAAIVATVVVVLGFFWVLFTGETNEQLRRTGQSLGAYFDEILRYLTYNTDVRPFPFDAGWPSSGPD